MLKHDTLFTFKMKGNNTFLIYLCVRRRVRAYTCKGL